MLLGLGPKKPAAAATPATGNIFDVGATDFEARVMHGSMDVPVLVDFWAPWCGPCKQLGPVLEAAVTEAGGKIKLAKVNIDENPELAQALRVQSVPTVFAFFKGQPVTAFAGARPASEVKMFIDQLIKLAQKGAPGAEQALDVPAALKHAAALLAQNDVAGAQEIYALILSQDENNAAAYTGLVRTVIAAGALDEAQHLIDTAPEAIGKDAQFAAARTALDLARNSPARGALKKLQDAVAARPDDQEARLELAKGLFAAGARAEAIDTLIESLRRNREWEEGRARKQLIEFFDAMGPADPLTAAGRRQLSSVLFS